ncbi:E3 ubiquitin-protein ligase TRIM21-like [Pelodiscus sinensis]|uniref:E3 ubiquitin-protein ligase TRIM21-like n=1 Tax=Pelodiscus sinensis TaxID=13735 RepID=UPI003F6A9D3A
MAATGPLQNIKAEVTCPICLELFQDPVTSACGHSFCRECIARHCQGDGDVACPLCNEKLRKGNLRPNRELKNIVESLKSQPAEEPRRGNMCQMHGKSLLLYCQVDQTPICLVCRESQAHRGHTVVPVEEAVQEHWETMKKQLEGMESTYGRLHLLVSMDRKHLSPSAGEEVHKRLKRLADSTATLFKVHTEGPRQRFEALASQPQPREPDRRGRGRGVATRSELRECQGREPGSEPAAEKQEETGTHVGRVCEEAPTPKYGLDQATLDPGVHTISNTTESEEFKVDVKGLVSRFEKATSAGPSEVRVGRRKVRVSLTGQGSRGDTGGGRGSQEPKVAAAGVHRQASPSPGLLRRYNSLRESQTHQQADAPSRGDSLQDLTWVGAALGPAGSGQVGISAVPVGRAARGYRGPGGETPEKQEATETRVGEKAAPLRRAARSRHRKYCTISELSQADAPSRGDRFQALTPVKPGMGPGGSGQVGVSAVPERGALRGRAGPGGEAPEEQEATETRVGEEAAAPRPVPGGIHWRHPTIGVIRELGQADAPSRGDSLQGLTSAGAALGPGCSGQVGVSPGGRVARPPELQGCAVEVTLDPATAHPRLRLSEDRKSVRRGDIWQQLPKNPERFDTCVCVLGSEWFTSGRHYWEVEVGPRRGWEIGVARDSVQRKGKIQPKPDFGIWALDSFHVSQVPRKVGVYLDYRRGEVRFYNAETMALIFSLTARFTGRLVPFFRLWAVRSRLSLSPCQR